MADTARDSGRRGDQGGGEWRRAKTCALNILAYLSFERYKNSDDLSQEFVERLQERCEREVRSAMRPFGFYEPTVTSEVDRAGTGQDFVVVINVTPGQPVKVDKVEVNVTGAGATELHLHGHHRRSARCKVGDRLLHSNYETLKGGLLRAASTYGYLDARMSRNEMRVDPQNYVAQIYIDFDTGERYRFGDTTIVQNAIDESLVRRFLRYESGQQFDATQLLRTQFALDDSQYFSTVEVLPEDRNRETHTVPIDINAEPNRRSRYQFGVGYGTDTEVRGTASWENRLVNRRGHRFRTEVKAATLDQSVDARYIIPIGDPATEKFTMQLAGFHRRLADTDNRDVNLIPSLTHIRGPYFGQYWQRVSYVELLQTRSEFITSNEIEKQTLLIPGISFSLVPRNYLGEALFSRGLYGELRGSHQTLGSDCGLPADPPAGRARLRPRAQVARADARRSRRHRVVEDQRPRAFAALFRRRRPQRARLRQGRSVAAHTGDRPRDGPAVSRRKWQPGAREARRQAPAARARWSWCATWPRNSRWRYSRMPAMPSTTSATHSCTRWASGSACGCPSSPWASTWRRR